MSDTKSIHTLNARGHVMLEVIRDYFKVSPAAMFREIQRLRQEAETVLASKRIRYSDLKTALVPDRQRREMALVFDRDAISNNWYGLAVFQKLIPLFDPQPLEEFEIDIDEAKLAYLKSEKIGSLEKAGLGCSDNLII